MNKNKMNSIVGFFYQNHEVRKCESTGLFFLYSNGSKVEEIDGRYGGPHRFLSLLVWFLSYKYFKRDSPDFNPELAERFVRIFYPNCLIQNKYDSYGAISGFFVLDHISGKSYGSAYSYSEAWIKAARGICGNR